MQQLVRNTTLFRSRNSTKVKKNLPKNPNPKQCKYNPLIYFLLIESPTTHYCTTFGVWACAYTWWSTTPYHSCAMMTNKCYRNSSKRTGNLDRKPNQACRQTWKILSDYVWSLIQIKESQYRNWCSVNGLQAVQYASSLNKQKKI